MNKSRTSTFIKNPERCIHLRDISTTDRRLILSQQKMVGLRSKAVRSARLGHMTGWLTETGRRRMENQFKHHVWGFVRRYEESCCHPRDCICFERVSVWVCKACGEEGVGSWDQMYEYGPDCYQDEQPETDQHPSGCNPGHRMVYDILNE